MTASKSEGARFGSTAGMAAGHLVRALDRLQAAMRPAAMWRKRVGHAFRVSNDTMMHVHSSCPKPQVVGASPGH
jgi:hypothetical protein